MTNFSGIISGRIVKNEIGSSVSVQIKELNHTKGKLKGKVKGIYTELIPCFCIPEANDF